MTTGRDVTLARIASAAYSDLGAGLPSGFAPVSAEALGLSLDGGGSFANGVYRNGNAAALVASGTLDGAETLVLAFRGSDDREDSINSLRGINADYPDFAELIAAVDAYAATGGFGQVAATGHSLGGAMTQIFMAEHPAGGGAVPYVADTFGSPGALLPEGADPRVADYVVADDPAVFIGENRAEIGAALRANPVLAVAAAAIVVDTFPGLTVEDALGSLPFPTADYENRGETVVLPGADGGTEPISDVPELLQADASQHRVELYVGLAAAAAAGATGRAPAVLFDAGFYLAVNPDVAAAGVDPQDHYAVFGWREGRDPEAAFDTEFYVSRNPDVAAAGVDPLEHYAVFGWREGRDPNALFDSDDYLARYADVEAAGIDPLLHYELYGWLDGRDPGPGFSTSAYLAASPDVAAAGVNPLEHYLVFGIEEQRVL